MIRNKKVPNKLAFTMNPQKLISSLMMASARLTQAVPMLSKICIPATPRIRLGGTWTVGKRIMKLGALFSLLSAGAILPARAIWINEIHYDNAGTDAGEFIEIAGPAGTDLSLFSLVLYNGGNGAVYDTDALLGIIPDLQNGYGVVSFSYSVNGIQNGSPDGMALVMGSTVIQFLSYEGNFVAVGGAANGMTSTDIIVSEAGTEPVGQSLQLNGMGGKYENFSWVLPQAQTPGAINTGQSFPASAPPSVPDSGPTAFLLAIPLLGLLVLSRRFSTKGF